MIGGPEAVVEAMTSTLKTYLPAQLSAIWADYNDSATVPEIAPRQYYAFNHALVLDLPCVLVEPVSGTQVANEGPAWGELHHRLIVRALVRGDTGLAVEKMAARYVRAIWKVLMQHPGLDGSISCGTDPITYEIGDAAKHPKGGAVKEVAWMVDVTMVESPA